MENLRSGELYVFSDNEFFNPPSYAVVSGWACDGISLSVLMTESPLPEPSMRIDWDCRLPHGLSYSRLPTDAERDRFSACSKYAIVSRNWSSIVSPITAIVARYGLREFFCVLRLWGNRATVEIRPDCRAGLPYFCSIRNRYVLDRGMVGRLPLKRMSRRSVGKSADDKRDRPCRFVSLPLQAVRRGEGLAQMPRFDSGAIDRAALGNGIVFFLYRARFRRADRLVNLGCRIRGFRTVCRTDVSCFRQAGLARFASVPNNNFHWKFVLLENSRTFVV